MMATPDFHTMDDTSWYYDIKKPGAANIIPCMIIIYSV